MYLNKQNWVEGVTLRTVHVKNVPQQSNRVKEFLTSLTFFEILKNDKVREINFFI